MSNPLLRQILEGARKLVGTRATWTRHTLAMTRNDRDCDPTHPEAVRFCAHGALVRTAYQLTGNSRQALQLAGKAAIVMTGRPTQREALGEIYAINDGPALASRHAILDLIDATLERV
jgi:hypothetical protein